MSDHEYIPVAHTRKTYGIHGALRLFCEPPWDEILPKLKAVFIDVQGGLVPYFIAEIRTQGNPIIRFEDINSPEAAKPLTGQPVFARQQDIQPFLDNYSLEDELTLPEQLEGMRITDRELGPIGTILEVLEMPQQLMAVVEYNGKEHFIPIHEDLILSIDAEEGVISMDFPEGLLAL